MYLYTCTRTWLELWGYKVNTHRRLIVQSAPFALRHLPRLSGYQVIGERAEAMTRRYLLVRFLALLQPRLFSPGTVRADPKVDQCLALGTISQIAKCLDPLTVGHSSLSQEHMYS